MRASGVNNTGRTNNKIPRLVNRRNKPPRGVAWIWLTVDMLCSPAFRVLSLNARRVLDRLIVEHLQHAGTANGKLIVTYGDLIRWGVRRNAVSKSIDELSAVGIVCKTQQGGFSCGSERNASTYRLEWLPDCEGNKPKNIWEQFQTLDEAREAAGFPTKAQRSARVLSARQSRAEKLEARRVSKRAA